MKKEYIVVFVIGLLLLAYVLDSVVNPLSIAIATPYHYFSPAIYTTYAFTTTSIVLKAIALTAAIVLIVSLFSVNRFVKGGIMLVISALLQLYALQDVASSAHVVPLEWSLAFTLTGMLLFIPMIAYLILGIAGPTHKKIQESLYGDDSEATPSG